MDIQYIDAKRAGHDAWLSVGEASMSSTGLAADGVATLTHINIFNPYKNRGLGSYLLRNLEQLWKSKYNKKTIRVQNPAPAAMAFYKKHNGYSKAPGGLGHIEKSFYAEV